LFSNISLKRSSYESLNDFCHKTCTHTFGSPGVLGDRLAAARCWRAGIGGTGGLLPSPRPRPQGGATIHTPGPAICLSALLSASGLPGSASHVYRLTIKCVAVGNCYNFNNIILSLTIPNRFSTKPHFNFP